MQRVISKARLRKPSKRLVIIGVLLSPFVIYLALVIQIHTQNARHNAAYDDFYDAAKANGLLVHPFNQAPEPTGLNRFYDESSIYKSSNGLTSMYVGYKDDDGNIILPAIYKLGGSHFYEGLCCAYKDDRLGFINPDGTWAFRFSSRSIRTSSTRRFFNGRAIVKKELYSPLITPQWREGAIDKEGNVVIDFKYLSIGNFIGELDNEHSIASTQTIFSSIYDKLMDGIDITIEPIEWLFPPKRLMFLDKDGKKVSISQVRKSIRTLNDSASQ